MVATRNRDYGTQPKQPNAERAVKYQIATPPPTGTQTEPGYDAWYWPHNREQQDFPIGDDTRSQHVTGNARARTIASDPQVDLMNFEYGMMARRQGLGVEATPPSVTGVDATLTQQMSQGASSSWENPTYHQVIGTPHPLQKV